MGRRLNQREEGEVEEIGALGEMVFPIPKIVVLSIGDELVEPSTGYLGHGGKGMAGDEVHAAEESEEERHDGVGNLLNAPGGVDMDKVEAEVGGKGEGRGKVVSTGMVLLSCVQKEFEKHSDKPEVLETGMKVAFYQILLKC
ncbi:hypothetical protein Fmac_010719 [Flemingia macrophylla]|uniref:Uncharacterized protein n=1 Tax=Flemingia macrophylla TaxID=520843 RepID=A0ABD1ML82_9FABA